MTRSCTALVLTATGVNFQVKLTTFVSNETYQMFDDFFLYEIFQENFMHDFLFLDLQHLIHIWGNFLRFGSIHNFKRINIKIL